MTDDSDVLHRRVQNTFHVINKYNEFRMEHAVIMNNENAI